MFDDQKTNVHKEKYNLKFSSNFAFGEQATTGRKNETEMKTEWNGRDVKEAKEKGRHKTCCVVGHVFVGERVFVQKTFLFLLA